MLFKSNPAVARQRARGGAAHLRTANYNMLKADIDSRAMDDKIDAYDLDPSKLGTDEEAAGNAPSHERIALARKTEAASAKVRRAAQPLGLNKWIIPGFCTAIGGVGAILTLSLWLF